MSLHDWDKYIAPELRRVEVYSQSAADAVARLPLRPGWLSKAEFELAALKRVLEAALEKVNQAEAEYRKKPLEEAA